MTNRDWATAEGFETRPTSARKYFRLGEMSLRKSLVQTRRFKLGSRHLNVIRPMEVHPLGGDEHSLRLVGCVCD
jgi:hypothetical protein